MEKFIASFFIIIGVIALSAGFGLFLAFPIKWCWNYVMPYLFELKTITWSQAWCLSFLSSMFIKSTLTNNSN
jgi:hypothetical protein